MPEHRLISDFVDLVAEKQLAVPSKPQPYVGLEHIPEKAITIGPIGDTSNIRGMCVRFREGDILFGKLRPNLRKCVGAPVDGLGSTEILVLRAKPENDPRFTAHVLRSENVFVAAERLTEGTRMPRTSWKTLSGIEIFAPADSRAQSLIADILDAIDDAIIETDALIAKLRVARLGVLDDLLTQGLDGSGSPRDAATLSPTEVGARPANWKVGPLGRFVPRAEYGTNLSLGDLSEGLPVLRMNNILDGEFDLSDLKYAPTNAVERFRLQKNDVLFNRTNSWEHVGKAAIWRSDEAGPGFASYLVRLHCGDELLPEFLHLWLNWAPVQRAIRQFATPGVQQVNINPTNLRRAVIAVPDTIDEQQAIVDRIDAIAAAIERHRSERAKLANLRNGLRDDLLTGRVPIVRLQEAAE
jgi:type I restriction enzyme S subunit